MFSRQIINPYELYKSPSLIVTKLRVLHLIHHLVHELIRVIKFIPKSLFFLNSKKKSKNLIQTYYFILVRSKSLQKKPL